MIIAALLFLLGVLPIAAQVGEAVEPKEPEILLPEVVLEIEDLSVEVVEAGLPDEQELLPPPLGREIPPPAEEELEVTEPAGTTLLPPEEPVTPLPREESLTAQAILGAGSRNHTYSSISLYRVGVVPRFKLEFFHEMLDGFGSHEPGSGYSYREDSLEGGAKLNLSEMAFEAEGLVKDTERGLQGGGSHVSKVYRRGQADVKMSYPLSDLLTLEAALDSVVASQLLTGDSPEEELEFAIYPEALARWQWERFWLGLESGYQYSSLVGADREIHRVSLAALGGVHLSDTWSLEGRGGWFWTTARGSLFPFDITLSGILFSSFSFQASGGYRAQPFDFQHLMEDYPLASLPESLEDNHGWFTDLATSLGLLENLSLLTRVRLNWNSAMPDPGTDPSTADGLHPETGLLLFGQEEAVRLTTNIGLRWNLLRYLGLSAGWEGEFLERPGFKPLHILTAELEASGPSARFKVNGALRFEIERELPVPLFGLSGVYELNETVAFILEGEDLLYPFLRGPRYSWEPLEEPGMRATMKIQITL